MFLKIGALAALLPLASAQFAYLFTAPTDWVSGQPANVTWTAEEGDPATFSILLGKYNATTGKQDSWVLANGVESYAYFAEFTLPDLIPGPKFFLLPVSEGGTTSYAPQSAYFSIA